MAGTIILIAVGIVLIIGCAGSAGDDGDDIG